MDKLENTGERILIEHETPQMIARHLCAYRFAKDYALGKRVLDIGCGEGYGADYLSQFASEVVGVDYDKDVISFARDKYLRSNLKFIHLDIASLAKGLNSKFNLVCSFQVIEHILEAEAFLSQVRGLLVDDGVFICSTCNRLDASPNSAVPLNKFHVKEYLIDEFKGLLGDYFSITQVFGLKRGRRLNFYRRLKKIGIFNFLSASIDPVKKFYSRIDCDDFVITKENLKGALDFIAVCRR
jgi:SAM-dependent methyltransferase